MLAKKACRFTVRPGALSELKLNSSRGQVLHPRTAGFVTAWEALQDVAKDILDLRLSSECRFTSELKELQTSPPMLLDVTIALGPAFF